MSYTILLQTTENKHDVDEKLKDYNIRYHSISDESNAHKIGNVNR